LHFDPSKFHAQQLADSLLRRPDCYSTLAQQDEVKFNLTPNGCNNQTRKYNTAGWYQTGWL